MTPFWTDAEKVQFVEGYLNQSTMRLDKVARAYGLPPATMRVWLRDYGAGQLGVQPRIFINIPLDEAWLDEIDRRRGDDSVSAWLGGLLAREMGPTPSVDPEERPRSIRDLILERLPRGEDNRRWTPEGRTALVIAILTGRLERVVACHEYGLKPKELDRWIERHQQISRKECTLVLEMRLWERLRKRCPRGPGQRITDRVVLLIRNQVATELGVFAEQSPRAVRDFRTYGGRKAPPSSIYSQTSQAPSPKADD